MPKCANKYVSEFDEDEFSVQNGYISNKEFNNGEKLRNLGKLKRYGHRIFIFVKKLYWRKIIFLSNIKPQQAFLNVYS